jgi:HEAT repeat protein
MMRSLVLALVLMPVAASAQLAPPPAVPATSERARELERRLVVIEGEATAEWVRALSDADRASLRALAEDRARALVVRRRAVLALRHLPEPSTRALLERRAADPTEDAIVSRYALRALALGFGRDAFAPISAALSDPRAQVRMGAAEALAITGRVRARPALEAALRRETEAFVRRALSRLLSE